MSRPLLTAATASYAVNCALGTAVATRRLDTSGSRWVHHAVYVATGVLTAAAGAQLAWRRDRALRRLLPVALPLAAIPALPARTRGHVLLALAAAPAYVAALATPVEG
ncbi:hypothetical protein MO973_16115 [Paenibacillus sp. TRM 82003]|uniref:hypothetical protein n=1 Tax=Kineococcus sp. TRM81007 TaxID=2925831 RepID=UPI001F574FC4|nr:hypothetical protein [Kineococcus sp. TRM81007]MCI2237738.1 hypothetical protein [Kineococcus sp. TRM81007]MCI3921756.1 hypothetical protein [Paenibacillus sp. TRM 82003]